MAAIAALAGIAATRRFLPFAVAEPRPQTEPAERARTGLNPSLVLLGALMLCGTLGEGAAADWLALYLVDEAQMSQGLAAAGFTCFTVMMLIGRALGTNVVERLGRVRTIRAAGVVIVAGVSLLLLASNAPLAVMGAVVWGLGISLVFPTAVSAAGEVGDRPESAIAYVSTVGYGGFLLGPPLVGFIAEGIGLANALWLIAAWGSGIVLLAGSARGSRESVTTLNHA